jgi:adenosine deaminase
MSDIKQFIHDMPKAELHIHLEGAVSPQTLLKLAERHNMMDRLPGDDIETLQAWFTFKNFDNFATIYLTIQDMIRSAEDFSLLAYENGAEMAAQNIRYREITVTPHTHIEFQKKGLRIEDVLEGLEDGRQRAKADFGVEIRWVFDIYRNLSFMNGGTYNPQPAELTLGYALKGRDYGVIGFGLGGNEVGAPPEPFSHAFVRAKNAGLKSVPHAGETMGPESVRGAVRDLQADRIGHGVRAIEDESLLAELRARQIPLEVNPTSNICLGIYPDMASHPFPKLDAMGLLVTVNSDDPHLFSTSLPQEYLVLAEQFGYDKAGLARIARNAFAAAGCETAVKNELLMEFDKWAIKAGL